MRIWKLTPVNSADPAWKGYNTKPMFVRAESAAEAHNLAQLATVQYVPPRPGYLESNPWVGYETACEDVTATSGYPMDGPAGVLK